LLLPAKPPAFENQSLPRWARGPADCRLRGDAEEPLNRAGSGYGNVGPL